MIIDNEAFENSDFKLFSDEEIMNKDNNEEIKQVMQRHKIVSKIDTLADTSENNYLYVMNHISHLYYHQKELPEDFTDLIKYNVRFKKTLHSYVKKKLSELLLNESTIFFKEIIILVNLLSSGKQYDIFTTYNNYDFESLSSLFRDQEALLQELQNKDKESFDISFNLYTLLIKLLTKLCIINSTDMIRKATIRPIIDLLTESINMLKYTIILDVINVDKLNNILGQLLYYFSHMPYIEVGNKKVNYLIDEYYLNHEKQRDGYELSKDTQFGQDSTNQKNEFIVFKTHSSYLLLTMLQKLEFSFEEEDYIHTKALEKIISLYNDNFTLFTNKEQEIDSLNQFKNRLLDNFIYTYRFQNNNEDSLKTHIDVIDDFIISGKDYDAHNLEVVHNILLFSNKIDDYKYLNIGYNLVESDLIKNDYYEYFKLKTLDIILKYFIRNETNEEFDIFIDSVYTYIDINKNASHLLSVFSKLYLSMVQYYSKKEDEISINKAKKIYSIFININGESLLNNQYTFIKEDILLSLGNYYANELNLDIRWVNKQQLVLLGTKFTTMYLEHEKLELKYLINTSFANLNSQILFDKAVDSKYIDALLSDFIGNRLFYGLAAVYIKGLDHSTDKITDNGYKQYLVSLLDEYEIQFIFPAVYEDSFRRLLNENKDFIQTNIKNILATYIKNNSIYVDEITSLPNKQRLKKDLLLLETPTPILIEIYLGSLDIIYKQNGFNIGNNFLKSISSEINKLVPDHILYKCCENKFIILLEEDIDFTQLIKNIFKLKVTKNKKKLDLELKITVTSSKKEDLLNNSFLLMDKAIKTKQDYLVNLE